MKSLALRIVGLIFALFITFPASAQVTDDIVLLLPFDQDSGTTATDLSGFNNHGTISGATKVEGKFGQALQFDGVDDAVRVPHTASLSFSNGLTVEAWVNLDTGADSGKIMSKKAVSGSGPGGFIFGAWFANPAGYAFEVYDASGQHITDTGSAPIRGQWQHVAGTFDGSAIKIYLNGVLKKSTAYQGSIGANSDDLLIGIQSNNLMPLKGKLDDLRVYRRALSEAEIACDLQGKITENGQCIELLQRNLRPTVDAAGPLAPKANLESTWEVFATDPDGSTLLYTVDWGDGTPSAESRAESSPGTRTTRTFTHRFVSAGKYYAFFRVTDSKGAMASKELAITVAPQFELGGNILENFTARAVESPYVVTSNVVLYPGVTLTVEPGTVIRFSPGTLMEVRGALVAEGTADKRIGFTAIESGQTKGSWGGIRVSNTLGGRVSLRFADVEFAKTALLVECCHMGGPLTVADAIFRKNDVALGGYAGDVKVSVDRATFENNTHAVTSADKVIRDSTFRGNVYGLYQTERVSVSKSTFTNNEIALYGGRGEVKQSTITGSGVAVKPFFEGFKLNYNTITGNNDGVSIGTTDTASGVPEVKYNNIHANTSFNLKKIGAANANVKDNWWGTTDAAAIERGIIDGRDQTGLGLVEYQPALIGAVDIATLFVPMPEQAFAAGEGGLLGHWRFDGNGNNEVSGSPSAVAVGNATFKSDGGKLGGYLFIPSANDRAKIPYHSAFDLPNAFTVSLWFRQRADRGFFQDLVYKGSPINNYNFRIFRQLWNEFNSGPMITGFTSKQTGFWTQTSNPNQMSHNEWHHVAFTKDVSSSAYYLDGKLVHASAQTDPAVTPALDIIVGDSAVDTDIDDLRIYNRALTLEEIGRLPGSPAPALAPVSFSDITVSNITNESAVVSWKTSVPLAGLLVYGTTANFGTQKNAANQQPVIEHSIALTGLAPKTTYHYQPQGRNAAGATFEGGVRTFTTVESGGALPNLLVSLIRLSPASPRPGNQVSFTARIENRGAAYRTPSQIHNRLRIDVGNDGTWDLVQSSAAFFLPEPLASGATMERDWANFWTASAGTHKVEICTDTSSLSVLNDILPEGSEQDNCYLILVTVAAAADPLPETPVVVLPQTPAPSFGAGAGAGASAGAGAGAAAGAIPAGPAGAPPPIVPSLQPGSVPLLTPIFASPQLAVETYKTFRGIERLREQLQRVEEFRGKVDETKREELKSEFSRRIAQAEQKLEQGDFAAARALAQEAGSAQLGEQLRSFVSPREELKQLKERFKQAEKTVVILLPIPVSLKGEEEGATGALLLADPLEAAVNLALSQRYAKRAEDLFKRGNEAAAQKFLERAYQNSPHDELLLEQGNVEALPPAAVAKFVEQLKERLDRTARGVSEALARGVQIESAQQELLGRARAEVGKLEAAADRQAISEIKEGLEKLKGFDLPEHFTNFKLEGELPGERVDQEIANSAARLKTIDRTIAEAAKAGKETAELLRLKAQQENVVATLTTAREAGEQSLVVQTLDTLRQQDRILADRTRELAVELGTKRFGSELSATLDRAAEGLAEAKALKVPSAVRGRFSELTRVMDSALARTRTLQEDPVKFERALAEVTSLGTRMGELLDDFQVKNSELVSMTLSGMPPAGLEAVLGEDEDKLAAVDAMVSAVPSRHTFAVSKLISTLDPKSIEELLEAREEDEAAADELLTTIAALPAKHQRQILQGKLELQNELDLVRQGRAAAEQLEGVSEETLEDIDELVEGFNASVFPPQANVRAQSMLSTLSSRLLAASDPTEVVVLVAAAKQQQKAIAKAGQGESIAEGIAPAANIDPTSFLYAEARYLRAEGALPTPPNLPLKLSERVSRKEFAGILNKTADKPVLPEQGAGTLSVADGLRAALKAYGITPDFNARDAKRLAAFAKRVGLLEVGVGDLARPMTREHAVLLISHADQKWGDERK